MITARRARTPTRTRTGTSIGGTWRTVRGRHSATSGTSVAIRTISQSERDQEEGDQHQFQDDEVAVGLHQLAIGHGCVAPPSVQQQDTRGGAAKTRRQEQPAQRPGIAPDGLVADGEEHTGVGGDKEAKNRADQHEHNAQDAAHDPAGAGEHPPAQISALTDGTQEHHEGEEPEERQAPGAQ